MSEDFATDFEEAFLINEAAASALGWDDPVGKRISLELNDRGGIVVGMLEDFHIASLHEAITPLIVYPVPPVFFFMLVFGLREVSVILL